jgi:membrane protease YdiL (CAAX protease family)
MPDEDNETLQPATPPEVFPVSRPEAEGLGVREGLQPALPHQIPFPAAPGQALEPVSHSDENPPWNGWDVVLFAVVAIVALFVAGIAVGLVLFLLHGKGAKGEELNSDLRLILPIQLFSYLAMLAAMYTTVRVRYGQPFLAAVRWNWERTRPWMLAAVGVAMAIAAQLSEYFLRVPKDLPIQKYFSTTTSAYLMGAFGVFVAPFVEEMFFRGFVYPVIARRMGMAGGICITGGLFALLHGAQLAYSWSALIVMFGVGVVLTTIRAVTKSVAASTLTHMAYNFLLMAMLWVGTDYFRHLEQIGR